MGATNRTQNYNLPQFVGSDKPTWLGDFNGAMGSIDTQMKANNDLGNTANTTANTALEKSGTAQTTANNAQLAANSAGETANNALTKALQNEIDIAKLNLVNFDKYEISDMSIDYGTIVNGSINIASNSDGSVCKIYGQINVAGDGTHQIRHITIPTTKLRPKENINIFPCGFMQVANYNPEGVSVTISPTGNIDILLYGVASGNAVALLFPSLYFMKNFGDVSPQS